MALQPKQRQPASALLSDRNSDTLTCLHVFWDTLSAFRAFRGGVRFFELPAVVASRYGVPLQRSCLFSPCNTSVLFWFDWFAETLQGPDVSNKPVVWALEPNTTLPALPATHILLLLPSRPEASLLSV